MSILLKQNYHMHTARCGHAIGEDRAYVEAAIASGFETIGFSDHTPFPDGYLRNETVRMPVEQLEGYVSSILSLRDEYRNDIRILLALEVEYHPETFDRWQSFVSAYPFDYFIQGQHYIGANDRSIYSGRPTNDPCVLQTYADRCVEGMKTGRFLYLAHPDLINYSDTHSLEYKTQILRICETAKMLHVPLEINLLGINRERNYPCLSFWEIAGKVGNDVVIGVDAHDPDAMHPVRGLATAEKIIEKYRLHHTQSLI